MLVDLISLAANHLLWCGSAYVYCAKEFQCMCRSQDNSAHYTVQVAVTFSVGTVNYTTHYTIALQHDISMLRSLAYSDTANSLEAGARTQPHHQGPVVLKYMLCPVRIFLSTDGCRFRGVGHVKGSSAPRPASIILTLECTLTNSPSGTKVFSEYNVPCFDAVLGNPSLSFADNLPEAFLFVYRLLRVYLPLTVRLQQSHLPQLLYRNLLEIINNIYKWNGF